jgi:tetratricopeptide (TPR) repeat protein
LFWALWSADQREAAARVLGELDTELPATGLLRAEWTLARHDVLVERGAAASERSAVLQQALRLYAEAAPQDSGRIAALSHWAALQLQAGDANAALLTVDQALALLPKAEPYIALDHARLLALRAQVRSALPQASSGPREDLDQAVGLLRGSIGLRNPLAWAVVAQRLHLGCATPAGPLQAQAWAQAERLWREAWPEPGLSGVSSNASMDGRAALLRSAVAACAWSAAAGPPLKP